MRWSMADMLPRPPPRALKDSDAPRTHVQPLKSARWRAINGNVESPSFTFRLERVRSLRERAEEAAREGLARELSHRLRGEAIVRQATSAVSSSEPAPEEVRAGYQKHVDYLASVGVDREQVDAEVRAAGLAP